MSFRSSLSAHQAVFCLSLLLLTAFLVPSQAAGRRHSSRHGGALSTTFYENDGLAANGRTYTENTRLYGATCASNRHPLGTILQLPSRSGGYVRVTVVDRIGHGTDLDLNVQGAKAVMGYGYRRVGRISVHPSVVGHVDCMTRRGKPARSRRSRRAA